ncbi:MAG: hypothetical protein Q8P50_04440, partial [Bacillota bacterium]|nr:hypothetical protein [Bacillota bacterium]
MYFMCGPHRDRSRRMRLERRLFLEPLGAQARDRLRALLSSLKTDAPLAPVTIIVPTTYAGLDLRRHLGREGLANVRFMVPPRLAELLGAPTLVAQGKRPLTSLVRAAAVRAVATDATGSLSRHRDNPALHHTLRATFQDLRQAAPDA